MHSCLHVCVICNVIIICMTLYCSHAHVTPYIYNYVNQKKRLICQVLAIDLRDLYIASIMFVGVHLTIHLCMYMWNATGLHL